MANPALKPDKDFTKEVDQQIPQAELLAKVRSPDNNLSAGLPINPY